MQAVLQIGQLSIDSADDRETPTELKRPRTGVSSLGTSYPSPPMSGSPQQSASQTPTSKQTIPNQEDRRYQYGAAAGTYATAATASEGPMLPSMRSYADFKHIPRTTGSLPSMLAPAESANMAPRLPQITVSLPPMGPPIFLPTERPFFRSTAFAHTDPYTVAGPSTFPAYAPQAPHRKAKGHVASACVPCKKAHLRCDAQRPCARCRQNGKEDACVDVQHKKRGRPRLSEDRHSRGDFSRYGLGHESGGRRSSATYGAGTGLMTGYDDPLRRQQPYRVLKSYISEPVAPRYLERGLASDANISIPPITSGARPPEPAAYLTMDLRIAKASSTFSSALERYSVDGLNLADVISPAHRPRAHDLRQSMQREQLRREPNYLPPIYGRQEEERVIRSLGFETTDLAGHQLDRTEFFRFESVGRLCRDLPLRFGLAKQESTFFIVVLLVLSAPAWQPPSGRPGQPLSYALETGVGPADRPFEQGGGMPRMPDFGGYDLRPSVRRGMSSQVSVGSVSNHPAAYPPMAIGYQQPQVAVDARFGTDPFQTSSSYQPLQVPTTASSVAASSAMHSRAESRGRMDVGDLLDPSDMSSQQPQRPPSG